MTNPPLHLDRDGGSRPAFTDPRIPVMAAISMLTAGLHGGVTGAHFEAWVGYGVFFLIATTAQFLFGAFLLVRMAETRSALSDPHPRVSTRPTPLEPRIYLLGAIGNTLIIVMYLVSRTIGIPLFGPEAGEIEPWDPFGIITTLLEAALVVLLLRMRADWHASA